MVQSLRLLSVGRYRSAGLGAGEDAVKREGDVVRHLGACQLAQLGGVEYEQERALGGGVEHDREQHPVVLGLAVGSRDEHRLARIAAGLRPRATGAAVGVQLDDLLEPAARADVVAPHVAVWALVAAAVVDARQLDATLPR